MGSGSGDGSGLDDIPQEILDLLPADPFEMLRISRSIAVKAMSAHAQQAERESSSMRSNYEASQGSVKSLEEKVSSLEASLREAIDKVEKSEREQARLSNEKTALVAMVHKLNHNVAKLETFKRTLMQHLQDENDDEPPSMVLALNSHHPAACAPGSSLAGTHSAACTPGSRSPMVQQLQGENDGEPPSMVAAIAAASKPATSDPTTASAGSGASAAKQTEKAFYETVVRPWRDSKKVADSWALWEKPSVLMHGKSLREVCADTQKNFVTTYAKFAPGDPTPMTVGTSERKMRRVRVVMQAVETFRVDDSAAETGLAVARVNRLLERSNLTALTNGLILGATLPKKRPRSAPMWERSTNEEAQRTVTWLVVNEKLRDEVWAKSLFGDDEWKEIKAEEEEKVRVKVAKAQAASTRTPQ